MCAAVCATDRVGLTGLVEDQRGNYFVEYSAAADLWSLGMVLYFLCFAKVPYENVEDVDILKREILTFKEYVVSCLSCFLIS